MTAEGQSSKCVCRMMSTTHIFTCSLHSARAGRALQKVVWWGGARFLSSSCCLCSSAQKQDPLQSPVVAPVGSGCVSAALRVKCCKCCRTCRPGRSVCSHQCESNSTVHSAAAHLCCSWGPAGTRRAQGSRLLCSEGKAQRPLFKGQQRLVNTEGRRRKCVVGGPAVGAEGRGSPACPHGLAVSSPLASCSHT